MSFSGGSSDSECSPSTSPSDSRKATKIKTEKILKGEKKYYRQKFVERWLDRFKPWLARDAHDPQKPFCKACRCRLNCNKCHLQRHERTTKHHSNLQAYLTANGFGSSKQNIGQRKERKKTLKASPQTEADESKFESVFMDVDYIDGKKERLDDSGTQETLHEFQFIQSEKEVEEQQVREATPHLYDIDIVSPSAKRNEKASTSSRTPPGKKDRKKLLLQIQKDKNELMSSFNELFSSATVEKKEKNHVDLFFESVSSSVKALSPKLIAESKMRVSQLMCELELRAITENESNAAAPSASSTVLLSAPIGNAYIINHQTPQNGSNQVGSSQNDTSFETTD